MVYPSEKEKEAVRDYMAMGPDRSKPLHKFNLPYLKWGNQRFLRCMKVDSSTYGGSSGGRGADHRVRRRSSPSEFGESSAVIASDRRDSEQRHRRSVAAPPGSGHDDEEGIDEVREKIMLDLREVVDKMKKSILREEEILEDDGKEERENDKQKQKQMMKKEKVTEELPPPATATVEEVRPWNLRTRRGAAAFASKALPIGEVGNGGYNGFNSRGLTIEEKRANHSQARSDGVRSPAAASVTRGRPKFSVALTKKEIEEDFMALVGRRPPRRPKKRPRNVQKEMDTLFPGLWLTEVTPDSYKVPESAQNGR